MITESTHASGLVVAALERHHGYDPGEADQLLGEVLADLADLVSAPEGHAAVKLLEAVDSVSAGVDLVGAVADLVHAPSAGSAMRLLELLLELPEHADDAEGSLRDVISAIAELFQRSPDKLRERAAELEADAAALADANPDKAARKLDKAGRLRERAERRS